MESEIISGQQSTWTLVKKLGEGDAGEVYLVESLVDGHVGVLKRPQKSAFTGDILRQAAQIKAEGQILKSLSTSASSGTGLDVLVPGLLDQNLPGNDFSDRLFIVEEKASGLDLGFLARVSHMGLPEDEPDFSSLSFSESILVRSIAENGRIPDRILLSCLSALLETLSAIHLKPADNGGAIVEGYIYNDIKPEHIFWDQERGLVTLIDWGNAQFVSNGGASRNRQYSTRDDYRQFIEEMGKFLASSASDLRLRLDWPAIFDPEEDRLFQPGGLCDRIKEALQQEKDRPFQTHAHEDSLLKSANNDRQTLYELQAVHQELLVLGELPDYNRASQFASSCANYLIGKGDLTALQEVCEWARQLPANEQNHWQLVSRLVEITQRCEGEQRLRFLEALQAAAFSQGEVVLWRLVAAMQDMPEPNWWQELVDLVRALQSDLVSDSLLPFVAVSRLSFALLALVRRLDDQLSRKLSNDLEGPSTSQLPINERDYRVLELMDLPNIQRICRSLNEDILGTWLLTDPHPPYASLDYEALLRLLKELELILPVESQAVARLMEIPRTQVGLVLDAWERKDFVAASQGLRLVLLSDPDRRRVLRADQLILATPEWLHKVHRGPQKVENFQEFTTELEYEGRELRNHVGPASWLDMILESFTNLRKGVWPADLLVSNPSLARELPWFKRFERRERLPAELVNPEIPVPSSTLPPLPDFTDVQDGFCGPDGELRLLEPLDAWLPEARGSSARVYLGVESVSQAPPRQLAVKLMRMDKVDYSLPLFKEEAQILVVMDGIPGVARLLECGFILFDRPGALPLDADLSAIRNLKGELIRIRPSSTPAFLEQLEGRIKEGWTPYLGIEKQEKEDNLLYLCDAGLNQGQFRPLVDLLEMSIQICDIIETAHRRNVVYRDHKILHYYWQEATNGIYIIDWNVARLHPDGLSELEKHMDLVQFGARGLHHILTGRAAPGALPLGPTRPEEIDMAADSYRPQWTYDDQRLSPRLRDIIEAVLAGKYYDAGALRDDLKGAFITL